MLSKYIINKWKEKLYKSVKEYYSPEIKAFTKNIEILFALYANLANKIPYDYEIYIDSLPTILDFGEYKSIEGWGN